MLNSRDSTEVLGVSGRTVHVMRGMPKLFNNGNISVKSV